jgi:hypothetical protein
MREFLCLIYKIWSTTNALCRKNKVSAMSRVNLVLIRNWAGLALALFVLNFALTFHNVWPTLAITTRNELSIEIAVLIFVLALCARFVRPISTRVLTVLALVLTAMTIARYIEVTAPALFGRRINLYWDAMYIPHVTEMLVEVANPIMVILICVGSALALASIFAALRYSLKRITASFAKPVEHRTLTILMGVLIIVFSAGYTGLPLQSVIMYSIPITKTYWQQAEFITTVLANEAEDVLPSTEPLGNFELPRLGNADVVVQFVESYGAVAYDSPVVAEVIAASHKELAKTIKDTNRRVVSAFIKPPTFGGNSWLSHSSFMTGLDIKHLSTYDLLLTQDRPTLASRFTSLGYRSVALMPGLRAEWPEGMFYKFDNIYGAEELDYNGPEFGWWRLPDQFSLAQLAASEMSSNIRDPLFLFFTTISSHMPFRPTPPYQSDWLRVLSDEPYDKSELDKSLGLLPEWKNMQPGYAGTLAYTFTYLSGFLRTKKDRELVWIIIGDHQPPANVSGKDVRWDVPVHIISGKEDIIDDLILSGFIEGMTPPNLPISTMHELPVTLLTAFAK